jgi:hypothetical protein
MSDVLGGCLCGDVRFESDVRSQSIVFCHCRDCQYVSGGEPAAIVVAKRSGFKILKGALSTFESTGESGGIVSRHFCSKCGTPIFSEVAASPKILFIKAGSLDDSREFQPALMVYTASANGWAHHDPGIPSFPRGAPTS